MNLVFLLSGMPLHSFWDLSDSLTLSDHPHHSLSVCTAYFLIIFIMVLGCTLHVIFQALSLPYFMVDLKGQASTVGGTP